MLCGRVVWLGEQGEWGQKIYHWPTWLRSDMATTSFHVKVIPERALLLEFVDVDITIAVQSHFQLLPE